MQRGEVRSCTSSKCTRPDDDLMVACDKCKRWWHYDCHSFDAEKYDTLTPWFCEEEDCLFREESVSPVGHSKRKESLAALAENDDVDQNVDLIIEAAAVAQAAVAQRDKELLELRAELAETKLKLSKVSIGKEQLLSSCTKAPILGSNAKISTKLEIIKKIQANHQALLSSTLKQNDQRPSQSTPFREFPVKDSEARISSLRDPDMATLLTILNRNNVQELPYFSGENKREWPYFEEVYKSTTIEGRYSDKENVARLRKALKGEAYHMVSDRLKYSSDACAIMDSLRIMFGRSDVLVHDLTSELLNLPKLSSKCDPKLRIWAVKINGFVADLKSMNREEDLTNGYVLTSLASRLGASLYQEWQKRKSGLLNVTIQQFAEFLTEKVIDLPPDLLKLGSEQKKLQTPAANKTSRVLLHQPVAVSTNDLCCKCNKKRHALFQCEEFLALTPVQRQTFAQEKSICFTCLDPSRHQWKACAKKRSCGTEGCSRRHHPLLHTSANTSSNELNSAAVPFVPQTHIHSSHLGADMSIMFKIVPIRIYGNGDLFVDTYAFLDDGSSLSMIEEELFHELGLYGQSEKLTLQWTKGVSRVEDCKKTSFSVSGKNTRNRYVLQNVYTIKNLGLASQSVDVSHLKSLYPHLRGLPLVDLVDARPKILLGLDQAKFLLGHGQRHGKDEEPHALKTLLGWIVYGKSAPSMNVSCLEAASKPSMKLMFHEVIREDVDLHELVRHHFTTEEFGVMPPKGELVSREVSRSFDIMERSLKLVDRQYEIGLLWSSDDVKLPDSFGMAFKRLISLEKSLKKNPRLMEWQNNYFRNLLMKGYARIASQEELEKEWPRVWYAPTFIIINPNKSPPKPRCVADVAAKVSGVSLNTYLLKGPDNLVPLHAGLFKFRERQVAVNGDVREMFHRIRIKAEDQQCQRILWRDGVTTRQPTVYIMQVMMFGPRCSPSCAQYVKNHHANLFKDECPEAVDGLTKRTYVDDYFNSHNSVEEAVNVTRDALRICHSMNFDLVGIQSNSSDFLHQMPNDANVNSRLVCINPNENENLVSKILGMYWHPTSDNFAFKISNDEVLTDMLAEDAIITKRKMLKTIMPEANVNSRLVCINPNENENLVSKILGMYWHPTSDNFAFKISNDEVLTDMLAEDAIITKRKMLKTIMKIFDPLGLISQFIIRGRIILQEVWREGFDWDEPVLSHLRDAWLEFIKALKHIENTKIPRLYSLSNPDDHKVSLIIFVDASEKAFAAVGYFRFARNDEVQVTQVMAKARVAPVKQLSIPRLELQAAVLGVRLAATIKESHTIRIDESLFFSDSRTVLAWINSSDGKLPSFVASRIGEILDSTSPREWFHVGSIDNVADDGTKRFDISMGNQDSRWFKGPEFLKRPFEDWPVTPSTEKEDAKTCISLFHGYKKKLYYGAFELLSYRFQSRWSSSVRAIAFLLRFKLILQRKSTEKEVYITPFEFSKAEEWMFRKIQEESFSLDVASLRSSGKVSSSSSILSLSPFLDEEGTLRLSSRAQKANCSYSSRNPAILPNRHPLVDLFIIYHHEKNCHIGTATVISDIRESAWIISIRGAVERVRKGCFMCKKLKAKPIMPIMGQLPEARMSFDCRPFTHVGVDCFGPMLVKFGRGTVKRYGMIFTCLTFRAVQIELLNDLSLDQCTMAVRRFLINRVVTRCFYSDNGLNFVGTKNLLEKDAKEMRTSLCEYSARYEGILWRFIPAYSPWMGGAWERLIQSVKISIDFVLKGIVPREDVLRNALTEAQGQMNRRPLTHIPVDPEDPKPLTPNSMLFGEDDRDVTAPGIFSESDSCSKLYSRRSQHLMAELTKRWYKEYLPTITRRSKWFAKTRAVQVDDIVIVIEPNEIRSSWQLGRVIQVYPGPDEVVRMADVKLSNGSIKTKRSVGRLAVLDLESSPTSQTAPGMSSSP